MKEKLKAYATNCLYSCLLIGNDGLDLLSDAKYLASLILNTTEKCLLIHPDFMLVDASKEKSIGVDIVHQIIEKASLVPSVGAKTVVVINHLDKMTEQAQNMLLKLIEESGDVLIIGACFNSTVLSTIKSRCALFYYSPLSKADYLAKCAENNISDADIKFYLTGGYLNDCEEEVVLIFQNVLTSIKSSNGKDLLQVLNLLEEKDEGHFFLKYPQYVSSLLKYVGEYFFNMYMQSHNETYRHILSAIEEHQAKSLSVSYTKDNFFYLIALIINYLEEKNVN